MNIAQSNQIAWNSKAYEAWLELYGTAEHVAKQLISNPEHKLRRFKHHLPELKGKRIANPLGSNGRTAVSMALLGADVTVFDIASENERYAQDLALEANVRIQYVVSDFMKVKLEPYFASFDLVVMELGVLHYFLDLNALAKHISDMLRPQGQVIIHDFHPLRRKSIVYQNENLLLQGDYFSADIQETDVAYQTAISEALPKCLVRRWTLGDIITTFAASLRIQALEELPYEDPKELPGLFTLVAQKTNEKP